MNDKTHAKEEIGLRARKLARLIESYCSFLEDQRLKHETQSLVTHLRQVRDSLFRAAGRTVVSNVDSMEMQEPWPMEHLKQAIEELQADTAAFVAKDPDWLKCEEHPAKPDIDFAAAVFQNAYDDFLRIKNRPSSRMIHD